MSLQTVPPEVLIECFAPLLSDSDILSISLVNKHLRHIFLSVVFRTIDIQEDDIIKKVLELFKTSPDAASHIREIIIYKQGNEMMGELRELLSLVGPKLQRLTLHEKWLYLADWNNPDKKNGGFGSFFIEVLQMCPSLRYLEIKPGQHSENWWQSGGRLELARVIGGLAELRGVKIKHGPLEKNSQPPVLEVMLESLTLNQLTGNLMVYASAATSNIKPLLSLVSSKQNRVKSLELFLHREAESQDVTEAKANAYFYDFKRLDTLNVTLLGFITMAPAFEHLQNLRHLRVFNLNSSDEAVWTALTATVVSGALNHIESLEVSVGIGTERDDELEFFRLLGGGNSLQSFTYRCSRHPYHPEPLSTSKLNPILDNMTPSSTIKSINIHTIMSGSSFLHFGKYVSKCVNLKELFLDNKWYDPEDDSIKQEFLSNIILQPSLSALGLPFHISPGELSKIEVLLSQRLPERPITELSLKPNDLSVEFQTFLKRQTAIESLEINLEGCSTYFLEEFFDWMAGRQLKSIKHLTISGFGDEDDPGFNYTDSANKPAHDHIRCTYPALEKMLSASKYLESFHLYHIGITASEVECMQNVRNTRKQNGLRRLDFVIKHRKHLGEVKDICIEDGCCRPYQFLK